MKLLPTTIEGVLLVESRVYHDDRGFFNEVHHASKLAAEGFTTNFVQDNHSRSGKNVLRGLHFQSRNPQGKLVRPVTGSIFDVAVDLRRSSPTFGRWYGTTLEAGDGRQLWIPPGLAHGFLVMSGSADVMYKCSELYDLDSDKVLAWNDPTVGITWPIEKGVTPLLSPRDAAAPPLSDITTFD
ncbi:MAG: dTDP-4-dehydrorhamnose 3,5-epimerase [Phycisphaerae bacterium]|nr:dTDP-4-dehydrorhamnose 3,5-epimerase [Gemmatimonadaceae bacterium]